MDACYFWTLQKKNLWSHTTVTSQLSCVYIKVTKKEK